MYASHGFLRSDIGDVDVLYHEGQFHLFHLVLPNHDYIAHAVSKDGMSWRRVKNALFVGEPGNWDDDMLWTMHVSPDPDHAGRWRMFYTGLSRREHGRVQRIGVAESDDLLHWERVEPEGFPLSASLLHYESSVDEGRHWVSFRDPFFYKAPDEDGGNGYLLAAGRVKTGPVVRRGCVAAYREVQPNQFEAIAPLHHPGLYDDIEVPNLVKLGGEYYLIGSIREDAKIRYWHTDEIGKPWRSYQDNVLMARGNYAGRISRDDRGWLLWNFFSMNLRDRTVNNLMPPPKRLVRREDGLLMLTTYEEFDKWVEDQIDTHCIRPLDNCPGDDAGQVCFRDGLLELESPAGFQAFVFDEVIGCFRFRAKMKLDGQGKCGFLFRLEADSHDGYYLSLDLLKGVAQLRSWDTGAPASGEHMMQFESLQAGYWFTHHPGEADVQLMAFGSYLELSVNGRVLLSLADQTFTSGLFGLYLETCRLHLSDVSLHRMRSPQQSDDHLVSG